VVYTCPQKSTVQISSYLDMYINLYEKDKWLLQEIMWEQDTLITHSYNIQNSLIYYHTSNITWLACQKNFLHLEPYIWIYENDKYN
jgi:hypothetical protein